MYGIAARILRRLTHEYMLSFHIRRGVDVEHPNTDPYNPWSKIWRCLGNLTSMRWLQARRVWSTNQPMDGESRNALTSESTEDSLIQCCNTKNKGQGRNKHDAPLISFHRVFIVPCLSPHTHTHPPTSPLKPKSTLDSNPSNHNNDIHALRLCARPLVAKCAVLLVVPVRAHSAVHAAAPVLFGF